MRWWTFIGAMAVAGWFCAGVPAADVRVLSGFEDETDQRQWAYHDASVERAAEHATEGRSALRIKLRAAKYPGLSLENSALLAGWGDYDFLRLDIFNPQPGPVSFTVRLDDSLSRDYSTRYNNELWLRPGLNKIELPVHGLTTSDRTRNLDPSRLRRLMLFANNPAAPIELFLDNVRLEKTERLAPAPGLWVFDFGSSRSPVFPGFTRVTAADRHDRGRGFGWTSTGQLREFDDGMPDALCRDFISGPPGSGFTNRFAIDLPNDRYRVRVCGHSLLNDSVHIPARTYCLRAEGQENLRVVIDATNFYSAQYLFRGIDHDWWPGKDVWAEEIAPKYPEHVFDVDVTDGRLDLEFDTMAVYWLAICPVSRAAETERFLASVRQNRRQEFYDQHFYLEPYRPPANPTRFKLAAARGQMVSMVVAGSEPPRFEWRERTKQLWVEGQAVRLIERAVGPGIYRVEPATLVPATNRPHASLFCLTFRVAESAKPGLYHGAAGEIPIELRVWPFTLPAAGELPITYGWFYNESGNLNYYFDLFPGMADQAAAVRDREFRDMAEHGFNSLTVPTPSLDGGDGIRLDTAHAEEFLYSCRQAGLGGRHPVMMNTLTIARQLARQRGTPEFSEGFLPPFLDALGQLRRWTEGKRYSVLAYVVDEPREQALNPWNRNFSDTKRFLEFYRQAGLPTVVTLMGDEVDGKSYLPLVPLMDVVATHPVKNSRGIVEAARRGKTKLWIYNGGMNRLSFGFYPWAVGATGRWEWHYQWWGSAYDPFAQLEAGTGVTGWGAVMPSPEGPVPTLAYEKVRQGIDDYRYVCLLERLIRQKNNAQAEEAGRVLAEIRKKIPLFLDEAAGGLDDATLDGWRDQIAGLIVTLSGRE